MDNRGTITLNGDVPRWMKLIMLFIDRVGFPAMAFVLMFYVSYVSIEKMTEAIKESTAATMAFKITSEDFQKIVVKDHEALKTQVSELQKYSYGYQDHLSGRRTLNEVPQVR